jgi:hypothetical protein
MLTEEETQLFEIAFFLRMPVYKLLEEMPYDEFVGWLEYFKVRPFGWRDDYRASQVLAGSGATFDPLEVFPALGALNKKETTLASSLKASPFFQHMLNAKNGDDASFLKDT